ASPTRRTNNPLRLVRAKLARHAGIKFRAGVRAAGAMATVAGRATIAPVAGLGIAAAADLHGALRLDAGAFSRAVRRPPHFHRLRHLRAINLHAVARHAGAEGRGAAAARLAGSGTAVAPVAGLGIASAAGLDGAPRLD